MNETYALRLGSTTRSRELDINKTFALRLGPTTRSREFDINRHISLTSQEVCGIITHKINDKCHHQTKVMRVIDSKCLMCTDKFLLVSLCAVS